MDDDSLHIFNLTNYRQHPTKREYHVFTFHMKEAADAFEDFLKNDVLFYERDSDYDDVKLVTTHLFATKRKDFDAVKKHSYTALGLHRKQFISDPIIKWGMLIIFLIAIGLAVWGFIVTNYYP